MIGLGVNDSAAETKPGFPARQLCHQDNLIKLVPMHRQPRYKAKGVRPAVPGYLPTAGTTQTRRSSRRSAEKIGFMFAPMLMLLAKCRQG